MGVGVEDLKKNFLRLITLNVFHQLHYHNHITYDRICT